MCCTIAKGGVVMMKERHLWAFFAGTFAWTWIVGMIPVILGINNTDYGNLIFVFTAGIAPSVMGLIMVFTTYGPEAKKSYFKRFVPTRHGLWFVLVYAVLLLGVSTAALIMRLNERPDFKTVRNFVRNPLYCLVICLFYVSLGACKRGIWLARLRAG